MKTAATSIIAANRHNFMRIENLSKMTKKRRDQIMARSKGKIEEIMPLVSSIIKEIQKRGDSALIEYTEKFDHVKLPLSKIVVKKSEIKRAYDQINKGNKRLVEDIQASIDCIRSYHENEKSLYVGNLKNWNKSIKARAWKKELQKLTVGQLYNALNRIGLYIPGGNAILFTTALMGITPAKVAGIKEIIVTSPPSRNGDIDPKILVAADLAGADLIIRAGGAQAIGALAYGTKNVPKVDKIFGPGNVYVTAAKAYVASNGICGIDFLAGPSEIVIIADEAANSTFIARDLISQAEHDQDACAILLTDSSKLASDVRKSIIEIFLNETGASDLNNIAATSLKKYGAIIKVNSIKEAIDFSNDFAPEHLEIMTKNPKSRLDKIANAGTICLGSFTPVAISDYICPNHILPTGGTARYTSGINIDMFFKKTSMLKANGNKIIMSTVDEMIKNLSTAEGLYNQHGLSVTARLDYLKNKRK